MNYQSIFRTIVIILLLTNIFVTVYFSNKTSNNNRNQVDTQEKQQITPKKSFPQGLGEDTLTKIFFSISESYSTKNFEQLLALIDADVVSKFGKENMLNELNKLYSIFGPIKEGFFSSIYPVGTTDKKLYKISYDIGLSEVSKAGKKAILTVTVQLDSNKHKIMGIFLNAPSHQKE